MSIFELPNEIVCDILEYCDSFDDYYNWALVCRNWNNLMIDATRKILIVRLRKNIIEMIPTSVPDSYKFQYFKSETYLSPSRTIEVRTDTTFDTFFFICWGPKIIVQDKIELYNNDRFVGVTVKQCTNINDYGCRMPKNKNIGYICVSSVGLINRIVVKFGTQFCPILLVIK